MLESLTPENKRWSSAASQSTWRPDIHALPEQGSRGVVAIASHRLSDECYIETETSMSERCILICPKCNEAEEFGIVQGWSYLICANAKMIPMPPSHDQRKTLSRRQGIWLREYSVRVLVIEMKSSLNLRVRIMMTLRMYLRR